LETRTTWRYSTPIDHYRKGDAVGRSDISQGGIFFRFYEEEFFLPDPIKIDTRKVRDYLVAKIDDVRKAHG